MKDINGVDLTVGQTVVVASNSSGANVPILKKAKIIELYDGGENFRDSYIIVKYEESGRQVKIDGYMYMTNKRFCVI